MKTIALNIKTKLAAPGIDLSGHAKFHACIDISVNEIIFSLFSPENEIVYLQHCVLKANEKVEEACKKLLANPIMEGYKFEIVQE